MPIDRKILGPQSWRIYLLFCRADAVMDVLKGPKG